MNPYFIRTGVFLLMLSSAFSEDLSLPGGKVLKEVEVLEAGSDYLRIRHEGGIANVRAADLPESWREKYADTMEQTKIRQEQEKKTRQEKADKIRESLSESEKIPRYLKAEDILKMMGTVAPVSRLQAEASAASWNMSEALRTGDIGMANHYQESWKSFQGQLAALKGQQDQKQKEWEEKTRLEQEAKQQELNALKSELASVRTNMNQRYRDLEKIAEDAKRNYERSRDTTVIQYVPEVRQPVIVRPYYPPPCPPRPCPPQGGQGNQGQPNSSSFGILKRY